MLVDVVGATVDVVVDVVDVVVDVVDVVVVRRDRRRRPRRRRREVERLQHDVEGRAVRGGGQLHDDDDGGILARRAGDDGVPFRRSFGAALGVLPPLPGEGTVVVRHHFEGGASGGELEPLVDGFHVGIERERRVEHPWRVERLVPDAQVGRGVDPRHLGALERSGSEVDVVPVLGHGDAEVAGGVDERLVAGGHDEVVGKVGRRDRPQRWSTAARSVRRRSTADAVGVATANAANAAPISAADVPRLM